MFDIAGDSSLPPPQVKARIGFLHIMQILMTLLAVCNLAQARNPVPMLVEKITHLGHKPGLLGASLYPACTPGPSTATCVTCGLCAGYVILGIFY